MDRAPLAEEPATQDALPTTGRPSAIRAARASRTLGAVIADAYLAICAVLVAECVLVLLWQRRQLAHPYEVTAAVFMVLPIAWVLAAPVALAGATLAMGLQAAATRRGRVLVALLTGLVTAAVATGVSEGRHFAGVRRPLFIVGTTVLIAGLSMALAPAAWRLLEGLRARGRSWLLGAAALSVVMIELVNLWVLPRLYPAWHAGLALTTLWVPALVSLALADREPARGVFGDRTRKAAALIVFVAAAGAAVPAARGLRLQDNLRLLLLEGAPLLTYAVRGAGVVAPPPPLEDEPIRLAAAPGVPVDLTGRDILLITVDALRADHVGAYGHARPTTPAIDALAAEGALFEAAYTPTPHTSYAVTSLMTGKLMRPLLLQGVGQASETWAQALRRYGYRTAGFYPPAVFFVDRERFEHFAETQLGFEYVKEQFAAAPERVDQVRAYLDTAGATAPVFAWVHLFEPHEPYDAHDAYPFGDRAVDRYDAEIAVADAAIGEIVRLFRARSPRGVVLVTADHGEEFGEHGGRYHGTTVHEEQVRVPLVVSAPGAISPRRIAEPVSLVDLLPTTLSALRMPISPRIRGRDLAPLLGGEPPDGEVPARGFAFAETDEHTMIGEGSLRLLCARKVGACRLYDVSVDPLQTEDVSGRHPREVAEMKSRLHAWVSSVGRYEQVGEDGEGRWPRALRRGLAGDVDVAIDVAALLDDADVRIRRKAAEVLFELRQDAVAPHLRRVIGREEDEAVRRYAALGLTRLGQGAPLTLDLLAGDDLELRRLAALALAESGDGRGERVLLDWWMRAYPQHERDRQEVLGFARAREVVAAFGRIRSRIAVGPLTWGLRDVRLRVHVAEALQQIGEEAARPALAAALANEPYHHARVAIARALVELGAGGELREPLIRFMGVPDPIPEPLGLATRAGVLSFVGGPNDKGRDRLQSYGNSGVVVGMHVPEGGNGRGLRVFVRARLIDGQPGEVRFGAATGLAVGTSDPGGHQVPRRAPRLDPELTTTLHFEGSTRPLEQHRRLPSAVADLVKPGEYGEFAVYATQNVEVLACAVVPLADELP